MADKSRYRSLSFGVFPLIWAILDCTGLVNANAPAGTQIINDEELVNLWLSGRPQTTRRAYQADGEWFLRALPRGLRGTTVVDVLTAAQQIEGAPATRARRVAAIKSLLTFAFRVGYLEANFGRVLRCPARPVRLHERLLDTDDVAKIVREAAPGRDRLLVKFLYFSGARIAEAVSLRWRDLGVASVTVIGKGSRTRMIPVPTTIVVELRMLRRAGDPDDAPVFQSRGGRELSVRQARRIVSAAAREVVERPVSPHWLRHAHACHAIENGAPIHYVRETLGHASLATTSKYLGVRPGRGSSEFLRLAS